ncbi:MAG: hypothetical protein MK213_03665 [Planctomycetes bacterium]|nr:hypothetical protein [Planctomycetota bacterium]
MDATTFSWVRPRGQVFISVITGTELLFLDGSFDLTGTVVLGDFVKVIDGNEVGRGSFEAYQSPGPGTFVLEQLLPGYWSGNIVDAGGNKHPLEWTVDEFGRVTEGSFSGSAMDFSAWPGGLPLGFELDSVGRLHGISIPNQAGDWIQLDYLLVNEAGQFLGGPVGSTALGTGILQMEHAPG